MTARLRIAVVDVCSGNLRSVARALEAAGGEPVITRDPAVVRCADRIVVPGQGAFSEFAVGMQQRGLAQTLEQALASGTPFLGICLGLQVLFERSEETFGGAPAAGLGVLAGDVVKFAPRDATLKVPHIGWNQINRPTGASADPMLDGIADGSYVYFVHSYFAQPKDSSVIALHTDYGAPFCAAVRHRNLFACQFHPEKSQAIGLRMLANFLSPANEAFSKAS